MTGNNKVWRAPVAGLASVAMLATLGVSAMTANAASAGDVTITFHGTNGLMFTQSKEGVSGESSTFTVTVPKGDTFADAMSKAELARPELKSGAYTGWYSTSAYGEADTAVLPTETVSGDTDVWAHWTDDNNDVYAVNFFTNGFVTGGQTSFLIAADDVIDPDQVPSVDVVDHKVVAGWLNGDGEEYSDPENVSFYDAATEGTHTIDFTAQAEDAYQVKFLDGTTAISGSTSTYTLYKADGTPYGANVVYDVAKGEAFDADSSRVVPDAYTTSNSNKKASFWATRQTKKGEKVDELPKFDASADVTTDLNLYPAKGEQYRTVTFAYGDNRANVKVDVIDGETVSAPEAVEYDYGTDGDVAKTYAVNSTGQKLHYEFVSWQKDGKDFDFNTEINANVTLTAKWKVTEIGIDFDPAYGVAKSKTVWFQDGDTFAAPTFEREGFTLDSWTPDGYASWEGTTLTIDGTTLKGYYGKDQGALHTLEASEFKAVWTADPEADLSAILANLEQKVAVTKDGKYIKGEDQDNFTEKSFNQYVKDYQAYLKSKGTPKTNEDYAKLIDKLEGLQGKLVQVANATLYRLYNPNDGDHYYTDDKSEAEFLHALGWVQEKAEYKVVSAYKANGFGTAVYSVYNPNTGEHLLTDSKDEAAGLEAVGWNWDNGRMPKFYAPQNATKAVYRVYNPYTNGPAHHYASLDETSGLVKIGWLWDNDGEPMFYFG